MVSERANSKATRRSRNCRKLRDIRISRTTSDKILEIIPKQPRRDKPMMYAHRHRMHNRGEHRGQTHKDRSGMTETITGKDFHKSNREDVTHLARLQNVM